MSERGTIADLRNVVDPLVDEHQVIQKYLGGVSGPAVKPTETPSWQGRVATALGDELIDRWLYAADAAIESLAFAFRATGPAMGYRLANEYLKAKQKVGVWIVLEGLRRALGIKHVVLVFEYATVGSSESVPALIDYVGKKTWGEVVEMLEDPDYDPEEPRMWVFVHEDNPYRVVVATRNEMKWALGGKLEAKWLVQRAYRGSKKEFYERLQPGQEAAIAEVLGLTTEDFIKAAKKGSAELAGMLAARRMMRSKSGADKRAERGQITGLPYIKQWKGD